MYGKRVILFDLEFMHLNWGADLGMIYCMGWKELGESRTHLESVWDTKQAHPLDDKELCKRLRDILIEADMLVTYNGIKCDIPFLNTRLLHNGLDPLPPIAHKDVYYTAKFKLKLSRNRLFDVQTFLGFKNKKTPVDLVKWLHALVGNKKAQDEILHHCYQDVKVLQDAYLKLRPLMLSHPRLHDHGTCNKCGGRLLRNKIYHTANKYHKITLKCQKCHGYETRPLTAKERKELATGA
jgi:uncharacterized protein YprB with RNaseH-like and TPR domain